MDGAQALILENWPTIVLAVLALLSGLINIYQKKKSISTQDVIDLLVKTIQDHTRISGDRSIKDRVASKNNDNANSEISKSKNRLKSMPSGHT